MHPSAVALHLVCALPLLVLCSPGDSSWKSWGVKWGLGPQAAVCSWEISKAEGATHGRGVQYSETLIFNLILSYLSSVCLKVTGCACTIGLCCCLSWSWLYLRVMQGWGMQVEIKFLEYTALLWLLLLCDGGAPRPAVDQCWAGAMRFHCWVLSAVITVPHL